jgi:hypothetical protein
MEINGGTFALKQEIILSIPQGMGFKEWVHMNYAKLYIHAENLIYNTRQKCLLKLI